MLRLRHPLTEGDIMVGVLLAFCGASYYIVKEKVLTGIIKWMVPAGLFILGFTGTFFLHKRWDRFCSWSLTGMLVYYVLFEGIKWYTLKRSGAWLPPGEINTISEEEEEDINNIVLLLVCVWAIAGFWVTR